jgi:hypothetical protein
MASGANIMFDRTVDFNLVTVPRHRHGMRFLFATRTLRRDPYVLVVDVSLNIAL